MEELNSGLPKTNPSSVREEDLNPGPPDYESSALPLGHAHLPKTGVELELLTDMDMHLLIEKGMWGGISMVSKRCAKANNPLGEGYDPVEPTNYITYLDANNL